MTTEKEVGRRQAIIGGIGGLFALGSSGVNAQGKTNLTFWTVRLNTPELSAALKGLLASFEAANPSISITHEPVSGNLVYCFQHAQSGGRRLHA